LRGFTEYEFQGYDHDGLPIYNAYEEPENDELSATVTVGEGYLIIDDEYSVKIIENPLIKPFKEEDM
jgi:hypothetical protein